MIRSDMYATPNGLLGRSWSRFRGRRRQRLSYDIELIIQSISNAASQPDNKPKTLGARRSSARWGSEVADQVTHSHLRTISYMYIFVYIRYRP